VVFRIFDVQDMPKVSGSAWRRRPRRCPGYGGS